MILAALVLAKPTLTPVLTFHDVNPRRDKKSVWFDCTTEEFEAQIRFFRAKEAVFISVKQLREGLTGKSKLPANAICLTFADNYLGFYKYAWPIIKRERIPVAQFVHTDYVGSSVGRPKMTWKQLIELDRSGLVTVASQTCSHPADLTKLSDAKLKHEFVDSKRVLESKLGRAVDEIGYPNGKYDRRVSMAAKSAGYKIGFTEELLPAERAPNLWEVPRYVHTKFRRAWDDSRKIP